jgi:hypothetical protein
MPMKELQTVALGLAIVFIDVGDPDWVADPVGWLLVLVGVAAVKERLSDYGYLLVTAWVCLALSVVTWPPDSVPTLDETLGWVFSLPTLAFCYMLADSLTDATVPDLASRFRVIAWIYALVTVLPLLALLLDWEWLETPAQVLVVLAHVVLVLSLFSASDDDAVPPARAEATDDRKAGSRSSGSQDSGGAPAGTKAKVATAADRTKERAKETVDTVSDNVRAAAQDTAQSVKDTAQTVKEKASPDGRPSGDQKAGGRTAGRSAQESRKSDAEAEAAAEGRHKA